MSLIFTLSITSPLMEVFLQSEYDVTTFLLNQDGIRVYILDQTLGENN